MAAGLLWPMTASAATGDLNNDGCVDRSDYNIIIGDIRNGSPNNSAFDLNGDSAVNIANARFLVIRFTNSRGAPCTHACDSIHL